LVAFYRAIRVLVSCGSRFPAGSFLFMFPAEWQTDLWLGNAPDLLLACFLILYLVNQACRCWLGFMMCLISMRIGIVKRTIRMRCGAISSVGSGNGNSKNTWIRAVDMGIASSRFSVWGLSSVDRSLDASISIMKAANNASSI